MSYNQQYAKKAAFLVLVATMLITGVSAVASADGHLDGTVNVTEDENAEIQYNDIVGLFGQSIEDSEGNQYIVELLEPEETDQLDTGLVLPVGPLQQEQITAEGENRPGITVNTSVFNLFTEGQQQLLDPRGTYAVREPISGADVQASDQYPDAPNAIGVAISEINQVDPSAIVLETETNYQPAGLGDYSWTLSYAEGGTDVTEEPGSDYVSEDAFTLFDGSQYNGTVEDGLDGVYDLSNSYYPTTLSVLNGPSEETDYVERPSEGQLELTTGTNGVSEDDVWRVQYTSVSDSTFTEERVNGPTNPQQLIPLSNGYIDGSDPFVSGNAFEEGNISAVLFSNKSVTATYQTPNTDDGNVSIVTRKDGYNQSNFNASPADEKGEYTVSGQTTVVLSERDVLLDTISLDDSSGSLTEEDLVVLEANRGQGTIIKFPDSVRSDPRGVASDRFKITYDYIDTTTPNAEPTTTVNETLVDYGSDVSSGDTRTLGNETYLVASAGQIQLSETVTATLNDPSLDNEDGRDLAANGGVESQLSTAGLGVGDAQTLTFLRDIVQQDSESIDSSRVSSYDPTDGDVTLDFGMTDNQFIRFDYDYYNTVNQGVSEILVGANEFGPSGLYDLDDPRFDRQNLSLLNVTGDGFEASVQSSSQGIVRVEEGSVGTFTGTLGLTEYTYEIPSEVTNTVTSQNPERLYDLPHDRSQVDYNIGVELNGDGFTVQDEVTVDENLPDGKTLPDSQTQTVVVDSVELDTNAEVRVEVLDSGGNVLGTENVPADVDSVENLRVELDTADLSNRVGEELTVRLMRYAGFNSDRDWLPVRNEVNQDGNLVTDGPILQDSFVINTGSGTQQVFDTSREESDNTAPAFTYEWSLDREFEPGEENDEGQRVYVDRLNNEDEPIGPVDIPVGNEIVVAGNQFEVGDEFILRPANREDGTDFSVARTVEESSTVNENQVVIDTNIPQVEDTGDLEDRFELIGSESGEVVFNYTTVDQDIDAEIDPEEINLNANATAELNITSDLTGYDVIVESERLNSEELLEIFTDEAVSEYNIETEDEDAGQVRLRGLDGEADTLGLDMTSLSTGNYTLNMSAADTNANTSVSFNVSLGPGGDAFFTDPNTGNEEERFEVATGDTARIGIDLSRTDSSTVEFASEDFQTGPIEIRSTGEEQIVLEMDTQRADGETTSGEQLGFEDVFTVQGGEFVDPPDLPPVTEHFETGDYPIELFVEDKGTDLAVIEVSQQESRNINTWVMPRGTAPTLTEALAEANQQEDVSMGDVLVVQLDVNGFDSPGLITNETDPAKLVDPHRRAELSDQYDTAQEFVDSEVDGVDSVAEANQINLEIDGEKPRNRPVPRLLVEEAENIETVNQPGAFNDSDVENDELLENKGVFLYYSLTPDIFEDFDEEYDLEMNQDYINDYEIQLNFTEDYKFVDENDNDSDINESMSVGERVVNPGLTPIPAESQDLEIRWGLTSENNSTVNGTTDIAPGTEIEVILRDDIEKTVEESPLTLTKDVEVNSTQDSESNLIEADFDLSDLEPGRNMTLEFFPVSRVGEQFEEDSGERRKPAIITAPPETPEPPVIRDISVDFGDGTGVAGDEITFNPTVENVNGRQLQYSWRFGDGSTSQRVSPTNVFSSPGSYEITLRVEDPQDSNLSDTGSTTVRVAEVPRTAPRIVQLLGPDQLDVGEEGEFGVVAVDEQADPENLIYQWDFDDGTTSAGIDATKTYDVEGDYNVQVIVSDPEDPNLRQTRSIQVTVEEQQNNGNDSDGNNNTTEEFELIVNALDNQTQEAVNSTLVQIENGDTGSVAAAGEVDQNGQFVVTVEEGNYLVTGIAEGYEEYETGLQLDENSTVQLDMVPENQGDEGGSPSAPGFTVIIALVALVAAAGYVYYRRQNS